MRLVPMILMAAAGSLLAAPGVPPIEPDYNSTVEAWWAKHPFNKTPRPAIEVMKPVVSLASDGDLQAAIDALPPSGGTIELAPGGSYRMFKIVGRSNVHIVGRRPKPGIPLAENERPRIVGGLGAEADDATGHIAAGELALVYGRFDRAASKDDDPDHEAALGLLRNPARNFFFRDIEFNGDLEHKAALQLQDARDAVFENCRFADFVDRSSVHGALVNGHASLANIWFFDCDFDGVARYAIYLDGAHGSGALGCRFSARTEDGNHGFSSGAILNLTNDDFTEDLDGSGAIDRHEERNAKYNIYEKNTFGTVYQAFAMTGENLLIRDNVLEGNCTRFAFFDSRSASTNHRLWDNNNKGHRYEYENLRVEDNTVTGSCSEAFVVFCHSTYDIGDVRAGETTPPMGKWVVKGNSLSSAPMLIKTEGRKGTQPVFTTPSIVEDNTGSFRE